MVEEITRILYQIIVPERLYGVIFNGHPVQESHPGNHIVAIEIRQTGHQDVYELCSVTIATAESVTASFENDVTLLDGDELKKVMFYLQ